MIDTNENLDFSLVTEEDCEERRKNIPTFRWLYNATLIILGIFLGSSGAAIYTFAFMHSQVKEHEKRITKLEKTMEELPIHILYIRNKLDKIKTIQVDH